MRKLLLSFVSILIVSVGTINAQQVTRSYIAPTSVSVDNVGAYGYTMPAVNFTQSDFNQGCRVSDVNVTINWAKTAGTCAAPTGGNSFHGETSFRIDGPSGNQILALPGTWSGNATTTNVITTFNQGFITPSNTPVSGTFGPNGGNLNGFNGSNGIGNWNLRVGDSNSGNPVCVVSYEVQVTTAVDGQAPVFGTTPQSVTLPNDPGQCTAVHSWTAPTATDACSFSVNQTGGLASGSAFPNGTSTVTYIASDVYGNSVTHQFTVTVVDLEPPTITCPANLTANAPVGTCAANVSFTTPTAVDNCPGAVVTQIAGGLSGSSFAVGSHTVTFRNTDAIGNTADCSFTVTVFDIEDPQINCPSNINVTSTTSNCGAPITYATPVGTDNCPGSNTVLTAGFASGSTFPSGTTVVTYTVTDASANTDDCSFTVTVDPIPNGTLSLSPSPICQGETTDITFNFTSGAPLFNVAITDGISVFNINGVSSGDTYTITPPTTVTYSYTAIQDNTGCVRTSGFGGTAQVVVTPLPIVSFSGLDPVYCESDPPSTLTATQLGGTYVGAGITDLGGGLATFDPGSAGPTGPHTITYTFTDINNCTDDDVQQVLVDEQPVANAGAGGDECDLDFTFTAVASVGTGTWTTISGPGLPFFSNIHSPTSLVQVSAVGTYVFQWTEVNGECSDSDQITVNFHQIPSANAGFGGGECDLDYQLGAIPSIGVGTWSAVGPGTASFAPSANDPNAVVTVSAYGTYTLTWTENNNGCLDHASVTVQFDQLPVVDAGTGGNECDLNFTFGASATVGLGVWTATGPGAATFNSVNSPSATVTVSNYGTYVFTWTVTNGNCVSVDQTTVNFYQQPVANAGAGGSECDLNFTFNGTNSVGTGLWTVTGPGTASFSNSASPTSTVTVSAYGAYNFTWTVTNGTCTDSESVLVNFYEQPVANAGTGGNECDLDFTFNAVATAGVGLWTASGPGTATFSDDLDPTSSVTVSAYGTYVFTWTEISGTCISAASVTVNFYQQPIANAGLGGDECDLNFLLASTPSVGAGLWSMTNGPGTASFNNASSPVSLVNVSTYGTYEFTWTETNVTCSDNASVTVNFYAQPVANAGVGGAECDSDFILNASPSVGSGVWTSVGPGTASFVDDTDAGTTVTVSTSGIYTFTWTETNGVCVDDASVLVTFYDQAVADPGSGGTECDLTFVFSGTASFGTGTWTSSGPGTASFTNANSATSTVTVSAYGTYQFTWTEVNGICNDNASITVNFYRQPIANAGSGGSECDLDFDLNATPSIGTGLWTSSGPGTATFSPSASDPDATVTVSATGQYTFTWTEDNNGCTDSDNAVVNFFPLPVVSFNGLAASYCIDQTAPVPLTGTPTGGTFTGLGISGSNFIPSVAGVGTIFITYTYTDVNGCTNSQTLTTDVNGLPVVSFSGLGAAFCADDSNAQPLVGTPVGGTFSGAGISGNDFIPSNAGPGVHSITYSYTDPFGCSSSSSQSVTINALPNVTFSGLASSYCANASSAQLVGTPTGGTFSGTGIIGSSFSPVAAGVGTHSITYTYTDANGCVNSQTQSVTVNANPLPMITPSGTSAICAGSNIILDAGPGYSVYSWSNNQSGQTNTITQAGTYNVIVTTAAGCSGTSPAVQIVVNQPPVVDLGNDTTICTGSVLNISAGNPGATYSWSTFEITQSINVTSTGAYTVSVTDANGCVGTDNIAVTVSNLLDPVIVANGPLQFCAGGSVTLDAGVYDSYLWSTGAVGQTISVSTSGVIELQVWDEFGCSGTDEAIVAVMQLPNAVVVPGGPVSICEGDSIMLSSVGTFATYLWAPNNENSSSILVGQSGSYAVTVTDPNNGCQATSNSVSVTVNSVVSPTIVPSGPVEFCDGESVSLTVSPGPYNSYLWTSGSTTPSIVVTETGDYGVTVLDANNCQDSTLLANPLHVEVWDPQPNAVQQGDSVIVLNGPFASYQWFMNGVPIAGANGSYHTPTQNGNYLVVVTDANGCEGSSYNIEFTFTGITHASLDFNVNIYPNPNTGQFTLEVDLGSKMDLQLGLLDVTGRQIMPVENIQGVSLIKRNFNIEHLENGVYMLMIQTEKGSVVRSIVKD